MPPKRLIVLILLLLTSFAVVTARDVLQGNQCLIDADEVVNDTLFVVCEDLTINGTITGNVIGSALYGRIDGHVQGNVYLVGGQLDVAGVIAGDLHFLGPVLDVDPAPAGSARPGKAQSPLNGSLFSITLSTHLAPGTWVPGSVIGAGYQLLIDGAVGREVNFWGSALVIDGPVDGNVYASVGNPATDSRQIETLLLPLNFDLELTTAGLRVLENGRVGGQLSYSGPQEGIIEGDLAAEPQYTQPQVVTLPNLEQPGTVTRFFDHFLREASTLLVIGLVILLFVPRSVQTPLTNLRQRPFASFSVGMLAFILSFPVVLFSLVLSALTILVLQVVGLAGVALAAGVLLGLFNVGGISVFYFIAIFVARVVVALGIGHLLLRIIRGRRLSVTRPRVYLSLLIGVMLLALLISLPTVGFLVNGAALFLGLGTVIGGLLETLRQMRETGIPNTPPVRTDYPISAEIIRNRSNLPSAPVAMPLAGPIPDINDQRPASHADETTHDASQTNAHTDDTNAEGQQPPLPDNKRGQGMDNLPDGFDVQSFFDLDEPD